MITREQFLTGCRHETKVIKHIASQLPDGALEYRPTEGQRSTLELMRYLTSGPLIMSVNVVTGNWDHAPEMSKEAEGVTLDSFADAMDRQLARIEETVAGIDEAAATTNEVELPWKEPITQSAMLMRGTYATFVAYRMQLFLYAKQAGNQKLSTYDCWVGMSAPNA